MPATKEQHRRALLGLSGYWKMPTKPRFRPPSPFYQARHGAVGARYDRSGGWITGALDSYNSWIANPHRLPGCIPLGPSKQELCSVRCKQECTSHSDFCSVTERLIYGQKVDGSSQPNCILLGLMRQHRFGKVIFLMLVHRGFRSEVERLAIDG